MPDDYTPHWAALGKGMIATENLRNLGKLLLGAQFLVSATNSPLLSALTGSQ